LEDSNRYAIFSGDKIAPPWKSGSYILKPKVEVADSIVVNYSGMTLTVGVPKLHPYLW
jgi:hypothetical protein